MGKQWQTLFWGGSKITADADCSHEIKRCLFLGRKVVTNLELAWYEPAKNKFYFFYSFLKIFIWLHWVLVEDSGSSISISVCGMRDLLVASCKIFSWGIWDPIPWPGLSTGPPALRSQNLTHRTTKEIQILLILELMFSSVQLLSRVQLFATPWIAACQVSLSITNSRSLLKLLSIESVMPPNHLIFWCYPAISFSVVPFSSCPQSLSASESFPMSQLFA